jgi:hypothetical protein
MIQNSTSLTNELIIITGQLKDRKMSSKVYSKRYFQIEQSQKAVFQTLPRIAYLCAVATIDADNTTKTGMLDRLIFSQDQRNELVKQLDDCFGAILAGSDRANIGSVLQSVVKLREFLTSGYKSRITG